MSITTLTYNDIITEVKNWIKSNCDNVDNNYYSMSNVFKPGYSSASTWIGGLSGHNTYYRMYINSNMVYQVLGSTIDNNMNSFINNIININDVNGIIPESDFLNFIMNMLVFCQTHCAYTVSRFSSTKHIIYDSSNTNYTNYRESNMSEQFKIIEAESDAVFIVNSFTEILKNNMRNNIIDYRIDFHI